MGMTGAFQNTKWLDGCVVLDAKRFIKTDGSGRDFWARQAQNWAPQKLRPLGCRLRKAQQAQYSELVKTGAPVAQLDRASAF